MFKVLDKKMMEEAISNINENISLDELYRKAGRAVFANHHFVAKTLIVIGNGYTGIIGVELGIKLKEENKEVVILEAMDINNSNLLNKISDLIIMGVPIYKYNSDFKFTGYDTFVDAIYGTDFDGIYNDNINEIITKMNDLKTFTISIDVNSGLDFETGRTHLGIESDLTVAIGYIKPGNLLNDAKDYMHELSVVNIGIPYNKDTYFMYSMNELDEAFKKRKNNTNKGTYGYVGVMGGSLKYSGSIKLSNLSLIELSVGAGVSRIIAPDDISDSILPYLLESTLYPIESNDNGGFKYNKNEIEDSIKGLKALAFGMGVGLSKDNEEILKYLLKNYNGNLLIDADGLNTLSNIGLGILDDVLPNLVLTPHVMEFSRMIKVNKEEILNNPIKYAKEFTQKYNCVLVLKGATTIVSKDGKIYFVPSGCVSLSKGGSGDILSGIITGIMGYLDPLSSALAGSYILGAAGDIAYRKYGSYSVLGRDIINILKEIMKRY